MAKKSYEEWMKAVDDAIAAKVGIGASDLPDMPYRDWYDDGVSVKSAASKAVKSAMAEF